MRRWLWSVLVSAWTVCTPVVARVVAGTTEPSIVHAPLRYPPSAVSAREEGTVLVMAEVDAGGHVADASVETPSGYRDLDAAALQSIALWTFRPATRDGKPVAKWVKVPIDFQLTYVKPAAGLALSPAVVTGSLLAWLGSLVWIVGFGWSVVLAKRKSMLWLSFMVAAWIVTYPLFVAMHWAAAKRNLVLVSSGVALFCLGLYVGHLH